MIKTPLTRDDILAWLREEDKTRLDELWRSADRTRQENVGGEVHLRGLVELSNHCVRLCGYCGLRAPNKEIERYRLTLDEVVECAKKARAFGYGTVVMQAGEDPGLTKEGVAEMIRRIKAETSLAVTLSLGEREDDEFVAWKKAGADRYLLRFETSNRRLYDHIHPPRGDRHSDRFAILKRLQEIGFEAGSGVMIGIPGQTYDDLANDIEIFAGMDLDMIGVGPYLTHPQTPLADPSNYPEVNPDEQVPSTELMTYKVVALTRLVRPKSNIPATTALATLNTVRGRELGLERGANVIMPNLTPVKYRAMYEIYPGKACVGETAEACNSCLGIRIASIGRQVGKGRGDSQNYRQRVNPAS